MVCLVKFNTKSQMLQEYAVRTWRLLLIDNAHCSACYKTLQTVNVSFCPLKI